MTYPMHVVEARRAVKYTGINSAQIAELIPDFTVTGETATELMFTSNGQSFTVSRNGFIVYMNAVSAVFNNEDDFTDAYTAVSDADHVHDLVLTTGGAKAAPGDDDA